MDFDIVRRIGTGLAERGESLLARIHSWSLFFDAVTVTRNQPPETFKAENEKLAS
jgi:hypothetical protein